MNKLSLIVLCAALSIPACSQTQPAGRPSTGNAQLPLASRGTSPYVIVVADDAITSERTAAAQLQKYLHQMTDAEFPIRDAAEVASSAPQILVGQGQRVKVLLPDQNWDMLGHDGIVIKSVGQNLILTGGRPRGTLYAVFEFLEEAGGCRFWTPGESTIPHRAIWRLPPQDQVYVPPFAYRENYMAALRDYPEFATVLHENGHFERQSADWGGHYSILGWCHTFSQLLPPTTYFKAHPEWYSDPQNGALPCTASSKMPNPTETQLCLSNPEVVDAMTEQVLQWIKKNPEAGYISVSQNDNRNNFCHCPKCMAIAAQEGSQSGPLIRFVNAVAARVGQQYPDFKIETLAYLYSEKPPKLTAPAANVIVRYAPIDADFSHPIDSAANAVERDELIDWAKIAPQLMVWTYVTNFSAYWMPHPNWAGLGPDLKFFAAHRVRGVFEEGDPYTQTVGDMVQLRTWLMGKLLWNPSLDQQQLTDEFLQDYYGKAAPEMRAYLDLIQESFPQQGRKLSQDNQDFSYLSLDVMNRATRLFDQAAAAVRDDATLSTRVRRQRLDLDLVWIVRYNKLRPESVRLKQPFLGPADPQKALDRFVHDAPLYGETNFSPGGEFASLIPQLQASFSPPVALPDFARAYPASDVIDLFRKQEFYLYRKGDLSGIVDDPAASDRRAAAIVGDVVDWAVQAPMSRVFEGAQDEPWHVFAMVRVASKAGAALDGTGLETGVYDKGKKQSLKDFTVPLAKLAGSQYHCIDLGVHNLNADCYVWFAPTRNPSVDKVYVDRVILIRQPPAK